MGQTVGPEGGIIVSDNSSHVLTEESATSLFTSTFSTPLTHFTHTPPESRIILPLTHPPPISLPLLFPHSQSTRMILPEFLLAFPLTHTQPVSWGRPPEDKTPALPHRSQTGGS